MASESQTREVEPLSVRADVVPDSLSEVERTVDVIFTTGVRVKRHDWFDGPFLEELSTEPKHVRMGRLQSGRAPVLLQHNSWDPDAHQGVVVSASIKPGQGTAKLRFLKDDVDADKTWNKIRQGVLTSVSVGYRVHKIEETKATDGSLPVRKAVDWEPIEISPVSIPADPDAHARAETRRTNSCEFIITRGEAPQKEQQHMTTESTKAPATAAAAQTTTTPAVDEAAVRAASEAAKVAERERAESIRTAVRKAKLDDALADKLVKDGTALDAARGIIIDTIAERASQAGPSEAPSGARATVGEEARDKARAQKVAWLLVRAGAADIIERASKHPLHGHHFRNVPLDPGEVRGSTFLDMARGFLTDNKVNVRGLSSMEVAGRALAFRSGFQGTDTFPVLFEQALHKILLAAYVTQSDTWRSFCGTDTVPDFRASNRYRTGELGTLDVVPENAEYTHKSLPDGSKVQISTETRGNLITLSRQAIINDDMGALSDTAQKFGRMGGRTIEVNVYALLAQNGGLGPTMGDGNPFFHASRGNVGTGSALGVSAINADKVLMKRQKDPSGQDFLDIVPKVLLLADSLEADANVYNDAQYDPADNKFQKPNTVRGLFTRVIGSPRLSGTRRYMFADTGSGVVAFKVVYLEGQGELPFMDLQEGFSVDGTTWKIRQDVKVVPFDPKGAITNAGA